MIELIDEKEMKRCNKCGKLLSIEMFYKNKSNKDGFQRECKQCIKKYREENKDKIKKYYEENKDKINEKQKKYYEENKDKISEIGKKYYEENKDKISERMKKYYEENKDKINEKQKKYREENKDKINEKQKKYREENKDKINEQYNIYIKNRRKTDPIFKLKDQMRHCISKSFKKQKYIKQFHTEQIVGLPIGELIEYLKQTYYKNYNEEYTNQEVHIDHIIPISTAKTEEDVYKLNHYTNLQLLKPEDNLEKSDKLDWSIEE